MQHRRPAAGRGVVEYVDNSCDCSPCGRALVMEACHRVRGRHFGVSPAQVVGAATAGGRDAVSLAISARLLYVSGEIPRRQASPLFHPRGRNSRVSEHVVIAVEWGCSRAECNLLSRAPASGTVPGLNGSTDRVKPHAVAGFAVRTPRIVWSWHYTNRVASTGHAGTLVRCRGAVSIQRRGTASPRRVNVLQS